MKNRSINYSILGLILLICSFSTDPTSINTIERLDNTPEPRAAGLFGDFVNATLLSDDASLWNDLNSYTPVIATHDNVLHVVWRDRSNGPWRASSSDYEIMYCNYTAANGWTNATVISDGYQGTYWNDGNSVSPDIAVDNSGNVHVVWEDDTNGWWGVDTEIMYCNYTAANGWSNISVISDDSTLWNNGFSLDPSIDVDDGGNIHVVWYDQSDGWWETDNEIFYCNRTGGIWSNITVVSDDVTLWNDGSSAFPDIAVSGAGIVHIVWNDGTDGLWKADPNDNEVMYSRRIAGVWSNATVISDGYQGSYWNDESSHISSIALDKNGDAHVVWEENTDGIWGNDQEVAYCKNTSSGWTNVTVISDGYQGIYWNSGSSDKPDLVVDDSGDVHVVWVEGTNGFWGSDDEVLYASYSSVNDWSNVSVVSDDATGWNNDNSQYPTITIDDAQQLHVVWDDETNDVWGTDQEILYSKFIPPSENGGNGNEPPPDEPPGAIPSYNIYLIFGIIGTIIILKSKKIRK